MFKPNHIYEIVKCQIDHRVFNPTRRAALRPQSRTLLQISEDHFAILIIGNDWRNKGVPVLLDALSKMASLPVCLVIVSGEELSRCRKIIREKGLDSRVRLLPPRQDVEFYYAAADVYVGPSLQDSYSLPPAEAMACGMPVIVSASAGVSEIITHEVDGLVLDDPTNAEKLASMILRLYKDREFGLRLGMRANKTAQKYTWENNGRKLAAIFDDILQRKSPSISKAQCAKEI